MEKIGFFVGHKNYSAHAALLCKSLIMHTTLADNAKIFILTPAHLNLSLDIPNTVQMDYFMPTAYRNVPFVDKLLAAAVFETVCKDTYLWMDVDGCFFKNLRINEASGICVNPVDIRNIGDLCGTTHSALWQILYSYFEIKPGFLDAHPVITTVSRERIYPYYNAGMVAVFENRGLFRMVKDAVFSLLKRPDVLEIIESSPTQKIFFHQAVFTCAALNLYGMHEIHPLPYGVNYPLHLHEKHPDPMVWEDLVSIRYDTYFESHGAAPLNTDLFLKNTNALKMTWYYQ